MKTSERRKLILDLLDQSEMVKTQELMKTFDTSESTIRRDLTVLAENGKIVRVHGGAIGVDLYNYGLTVEKTTNRVYRGEAKNRQNSECLC